MAIKSGNISIHQKNLLQMQAMITAPDTTNGQTTDFMTNNSTANNALNNKDELKNIENYCIDFQEKLALFEETCENKDIFDF
jgi:hypothetical protein